jgi:hypothetical protein
MGTSYGTGIVTSGIVINLDAANTKSYTGSGTTWSDTAGNNYNANLSPTASPPTYTSGYFTYNGTANESLIANPGNSTVGVKIGRRWDIADFWGGRVSNVKIYNRALTAAEVLQNFNALRTRYGL